MAAPGVDIFLPAPDGKYQMTSGTSFSAAYVSGLAALMLERNPALKPGDLRVALMASARDLGTPGRDDLFGAGEADAYGAVMAAGGAAVSAATGGPATPVVAVSSPEPAAAAAPASDAAAATTGGATPASAPPPAAGDRSGADPSAK